MHLAESPVLEQQTESTTTITEPTTTAKPKQPSTPAAVLASLENQARRAGMTVTEFEQVQRLGPCPDQIQERIVYLRAWLPQWT